MAQAQANAQTNKTRTDVAVLIPCYNEEVTIAKVVDDFRAALPGAPIYVYDNNSKDATARIAADTAPSWWASRVRARATWYARCFATSRPSAT